MLWENCLVSETVSGVLILQRQSKSISDTLSYLDSLSLELARGKSVCGQVSPRVIKTFSPRLSLMRDLQFPPYTRPQTCCPFCLLVSLRGLLSARGPYNLRNLSPSELSESLVLNLTLPELCLILHDAFERLYDDCIRDLLVPSV